MVDCGGDDGEAWWRQEIYTNLFCIYIAAVWTKCVGCKKTSSKSFLVNTSLF